MTQNSQAFTDIGLISPTVGIYDAPLYKSHRIHSGADHV